ncbi:maleylacetate reductase [Ensifer adhaerens]|uniref:maleylacetate reductase n=1 Tax=Ensifer adhaerens TaxID=106592 RepID=UPI000FDAC357|nr:maleylacetate reductase [Ensifer adhaerens]MDF8357653.1 maleylacetate reductase [Ensifer adhaerens]THA60202.1 maleylacetate reductase [Ensifer adhaerens]
MAIVSPFAFESFPIRVVFGEGQFAQLPSEVDRLSRSRLFVISHDLWLAHARTLLGERIAATFTEAAQHTPVEVTDKALAILRDEDADGIVAIGGGSAIGLGKALALRTKLPQIVVPTTYSGSEMTSLVGQTNGGVKSTLKDPTVRPATVIYDPSITHTLDLRISAASGLNAIAHGVEALYAPDSNPVIRLMALEGIGSMVKAIEGLIVDAHGMRAREMAFYGSWLNGMCLGSTTMGLHHKLCHTLGGMFGLPHAEMHAAMLPHTLAYNRPAIRQDIDDLARVLGAKDPATAFAALLRKAGLPVSLNELGMPFDGIEAAIDLALRDAYANPRPLEKAALVETLKRAHSGVLPES